MLKCREFTSMASEYIDGQLPWPRRVAMRFHLLICDHCRRFIRGWRQTVKVLKQLDRGREAPPEALLQRIDDALEQRLSARPPPNSS